ncbi:MAG: hypothetical protein DRH26_05355 [Deltaproteobacteria bacterium]|nr:MAG: hypothetical protein DRH26_05355 [Deltaproteobacteria bacterium]
MATPSKIPDRASAKDQKNVINTIDRNRHRKFGAYSYRPEYAEIAFNLLSDSGQAKTKEHVCNALCCSKPTLLNWMKTFPEFKAAVEDGLTIGEMKWRDKIREYAFSPTSEVNNGLIKLLSSNVYGIKEDISPAVIITNQNNLCAEEEMERRGIPIPKIGVEDINA